MNISQIFRISKFKIFIVCVCFLESIIYFGIRLAFIISSHQVSVVAPIPQKINLSKSSFLKIYSVKILRNFSIYFSLSIFSKSSNPFYILWHMYTFYIKVLLFHPSKPFVYHLILSLPLFLHMYFRSSFQ